MELRFHVPFCLAFVAREKIMNDQVHNKRFLALAVSGLCLAALVAASGQTAPAATGPAHAQTTAMAADPGEKVFAANCARCHTPPMTLNPRVTGTILMHMRTRARLSRKDEKLLMQYLAP
jgi:cytochrome c553